MTVPAFEEYEPALDCPCPGCAGRRRDLARGLPVRAGGHPGAHGARRALVLVTAAGVAFGATGPAAGADLGPAGTGFDGVASAADLAAAGAFDAAGAVPGAVVAAVPGGEPDPETPQGGSGPLHGRPSPGPVAGNPSAPPRATTRADIIDRAKRWVSAQVPYSMSTYWSDGYRQDCSGYVSMAWNLAGNEWTGSLAQYGVKIAREDLQPGDMLLFHNPSDPNKGSHVTLFGGWTDYTHTYYIAYEQTQPHTRAQSTPMAYWSNSARYVPYRYRGLTEGTEGAKGAGGAAGGKATAAVPYPGARAFGPGAHNKYVTQLGRMLVARGAGRFYTLGPGPRWEEADRRATRAFQLAQGWRGAEADGLPGPETWRLLVTGLGKGIAGAGGKSAARAAGGGAASGGGASAGRAASGGTTAGVPAYPGLGSFRPGRSGPYVERLGERLVRKGFGRHYTSGPGPSWGEADRRNVEAFQRAQGWRGSAADGYPGPETWRRLFE
ncbi:peptidoglycan-binding protein [Streptomyces sp. NPDC088261]|uniref:peptidoglycan-binding protein n=1 Tax=Streptomyces sp. NPDC088261 TaxID=3365851 RepID=UPI0037FB2B85